MKTKKLKLICACVNLGLFLLTAALIFLVFVLEMKELEYYTKTTEDSSAGWLALALVIILALVAIPLGVGAIFLLISFIGLFASKKSGRGFLTVGIIGKIIALLTLVFLLIFLFDAGTPGFVSKTIYCIVAAGLIVSSILDIVNHKKLKKVKIVATEQLPTQET